LIEKIAENTELGKKDVKSVIENMATVGIRNSRRLASFLYPAREIRRHQKARHQSAEGHSIRLRKSLRCSKQNRPERLSGARPVKAAKDAV